MKVEIWSEIACPWCGLGSHRLDRAVERFEHSGHVEVIHRSFPLGSGLPEDRTLSAREFVLAKYGVLPGQAGVPDIEGMAAAEGLAPYRVLDNRVGNTDLAHEFLAHASAEGKNGEAWNMIFRAYFGKAESIFTLDDLLGFSDKLGLDREQTRQVLADRRYRRQVQEDAHQAQRLGATGAPFTVIDGRHAVPGAQGSDALLGLLRTAWNETRPVAVAPGGDAPACGPDGCAVPTRP
ncbi:DsbA family oxidoreductase [Streptomyces sp. NBC_01795]|uniref:DsbA family oxidoreductase n=1 Tax=Streptomyces sp. NBC_01795 TaxID=2975943 RepID=UPI002DDC6292|nr:DsbA family oxidoreductase [Streptomyces sp. NBC_01795]WSA93479.1 DsbA family oxidoreductase [Streptomyces sp. NBC_01795]